jgi:hypothetical protein
MHLSKKYDFVIIGAGIIGLAVARQILIKNPKFKVLILEKEKRVGMHASGRNSGVLHAGFYYTPDSLKAKFCRDGNALLVKLAKDHRIHVKKTGKVVVATDEAQANVLTDLFDRGKQNGVELNLMSERELTHYEPLAKTVGQFLWSPTTAVVDKSEINNALLQEIKQLGAEIIFDARCTFDGEQLLLSDELVQYGHLINCAGSFSLKLAKMMGFGEKYLMIPFLGAYMAVPTSQLRLRTLVYPLPDPINPFLGTHFTITSDGYTKIGPTALPVLFPEQYTFFEGWNIYDGLQSARAMARFLYSNPKTAQDMITREVKRLRISGLIRSASDLVPSAAQILSWKKKPAGIRAQLLDVETDTLEQDFVIEGDSKSTHILNAVSPGWTSSLAFADWIVSNYLLKNS